MRRVLDAPLKYFSIFLCAYFRVLDDVLGTCTYITSSMDLNKHSWTFFSLYYATYIHKHLSNIHKCNIYVTCMLVLVYISVFVNSERLVLRNRSERSDCPSILIPRAIISRSLAGNHREKVHL